MIFHRVAFYFATCGILFAIFLVIELRRVPKAQAADTPPASTPYRSTVAASGIVEAVYENVDIGAPQAGLVMDIFVKVGDRVQKGTPLFRLDDRDLKANLEVLQAQLKVAKATYHKLRDQLSRLQSIVDVRAVSIEDVKTKENDVQVALTQIEVVSAQIRQYEMLIQRLTVLSPRDGVVLQNNLRVGQYNFLTPASPSMIIGNIDQLQVRVDVDEQNAFRVFPGSQATAFLKGQPDMPISLQFSRIEPYVIPKKSLTGSQDERVDTRVLQVIYTFKPLEERAIYVGRCLYRIPNRLKVKF